MKKQLFLFLLVLILAVNIVSIASATYDDPCCVVSYIPPQYVSSAISATPCGPGFVQVENCWDPVIQEPNSDVTATSCCCENGIVRFVDGVSQDHPEWTSVEYCKAQGFTPFEPVGTCENTCQAHGSINSVYVEVSGYVFMDLDGQIYPLDGAYVSSSYSLTQVETNDLGKYTLGKVPGNPIGTNEFIALTPEAILGPNDKYYSCTSQSQTISLTEDTELNFTLSCYEDESNCQPEWVYTDWSENCYLGADGVLYRMRTPTDIHQPPCNSIEGLEPLKTTEGCDESNVYGDCGNGEIDGITEQCDGEWFLKPGTNDSVKELTCVDLSPDYYQGGDVSCSNTCAYDISSCEDKCDPNICRNYQDCENNCDACENDEIVCGDPCLDEKPIFMEPWRNSEFITTNRSIFNLYDVMETAGLASPLVYTESTKDVELFWSYSGQCTSSLYGFKVEICEEGIDGSNDCGSNKKNDYLLYNPNLFETKIVDALEPNKVYCYNVCALNEDGSENCAVNETSPLPCFETGDKECMIDGREPGLNCMYDEATGFMLPTGCEREDFGSTSYTNLKLGTKKGSEVDCSDKVCIETTFVEGGASNEEGAMCVEPALCASCNGLFGLYADYDLLTRKNSNPDDDIYCSELEYSFDYPDIYPTEENNKGMCFKDKTRTFYSQFDTCEKIKTCYDYKSENSCLNDPCFKFVSAESGTEERGCEWDKLKTKKANSDEWSTETNIGVCKPVKNDLKQCQTCDYDAPLGFCSESQCGLYGDCYYKDKVFHRQSVSFFETKILENIDKKNNKYFKNVNRNGMEYTFTCLNEEDMSCYLYDSVADCIGNLGDAQESVVDVVYDVNNQVEGHNQQRVLGSNIIKPSKDKLGFGTCVWDNNQSINNRAYGCVKDADGSRQLGYDYSNGDAMDDDCKGKSSDLGCLSDNTPPKTQIIFKEAKTTSNFTNEKIPIYGLAEVSAMDFSATDNVSATEEIETFLSILNLENCTSCMPNFVRDELGLGSDYTQPSPTDIEGINECYKNKCELYPMNKMPKGDSLREEFTPFESYPSGEYAMIYYSEDKSNNLEEVQVKQIYMDSKAPNISFNSYNVESYKINENVYKSDLNVSFTTDEEARCEGVLKKIGDSAWSYPSGDIVGQGREFSTKYYGLLDGYYNFEVTCVDNYKNKAFLVQEQIEVQGDMSIHNSKPRGNVFKSIKGIELSLETNINATKCSFSTSATSYPQENTFKSVNSQSFTFDFDKFNLSQIGTWLGSFEFAFFTACDFENGDRTEGNIGDTIVFSVDNRSPNTEIFVKDDSGEWVNYVESSPYVSRREFLLSCNDRNALTPNLCYECKEIQYCFGEMVSDLDNFNPSTDCSNGEWNTLNSQVWDEFANGMRSKSISVGEETGSKYPHLYYRSIDNGGNVEEVKRINMKVKNIDFDSPTFIVSRLN